MNGCLQTYPPQGHRLTHLGQIIKLQSKFELEYGKQKDSSEEQRLEILGVLIQLSSSITYN